MGKSKKAFTLNELMVVVIIVGILAAMGLVRYQKTVQQARANEAMATLRLIQAGEKIYYTRNKSYYPASGSQCDIGTINSTLGLDLQAGYWAYCVYDNTGGYIGRAAYPDFTTTTYGYQIGTTGDATCYIGTCPCP